MTWRFIFPGLLILGVIACQKPLPSATDHSNDFAYSLHKVEPVVFSTSLSDTLPANALKSLGLDKVTGIEVKYLDERNASYFGYYADEKTLLKTIALLPFSRNAEIADTLCREISYNELNILKAQISSTEYESASFFWNIDPKEFAVYECIKSPLTHTLLINKKSGLILHRIENNS